ncbi:MAG TPA: LON peptidase substrate-binding domain-containing protein [Vicinamibacterales bacterium]
MLPPTLPLFPLPNVVLFPGVYLPLHIFEPRYREMTADALEGDRLIGMVLLRPGFEDEYDGCPPVYPIGCAGLITHAEELPDGRYNIILQGVERFRIRDEDRTRAYRVATIEPLDGGVPGLADTATVRVLRDRLERLLAPLVERAGGELTVPPAMSDADLIHALAQYLDLEPIEKQALLECPTLVERASALADLLEMKALTAGTRSALSH